MAGDSRPFPDWVTLVGQRRPSWVRRYSAGIGIASFELDLFGRVRNLSEAALQQFFAQSENRRAAQIALIGEVASSWLALAADESLAAIARDTLRTYEEALRLAERRHEIGVISGLELAQARTQVEAARLDLARYEGAVAQGRNTLDLLAGAPVASADRPGGVAEGLVAMPPLPADLSSDVLLRRPDIQAAEHVLRGANANIGAARAAFFPSISLTGSAGTAKPPRCPPTRRPSSTSTCTRGTGCGCPRCRRRLRRRDRPAVPGRGAGLRRELHARPARRAQPDLRHRWAGRPHLPGDDADLRQAAGVAAFHHPRSAADAAPFFLLGASGDADPQHHCPTLDQRPQC